MKQLLLTPQGLRPKISKFYLLNLVLFLVLGCGEGPPKELLPVDKRLTTTPPSRIFFKNIRSTAYQWEQDANSRTEYYQLRKIAKLNPPPLIYPVIADIWMQDQAHILLRRSKGDTPLPVATTVYWQKEKEEGIFQLDGLSPISQYEFALNLYASLLKGYRLEIQFPRQQKEDLFSEQDERRYFLLSMQDYLRLTEFDDDIEQLMSQKNNTNN